MEFRGQGRAREAVVHWVAPTSVLVLFVLAAALYLIDPRGIYVTVVDHLVYGAWDFPFLDTHVVLSWIECHRLGVDVFLINPCDIQGRTLAQSPLWLALTWTGLDVTWTNKVGLVQSFAFIGTLFLLPRPYRGRDAVVLTMAYCSPAVAYALERGNTDLLMFVGVVVAVRLVGRGGGAKILAYSIALLTGFLKFFPLVTLAIALRERAGHLMAVSALSVAAVVLFAVVYAADLPRIAFQYGDYPFALNFGAVNIVSGLEKLVPGWGIARSVLTVSVIFPAAVVAIKMLRRGQVAADLERLEPVAATFLLAGAAVVTGSFFATTNRSYRGIFLLLVIHGLLALYRISGVPVYKKSAYIVIFLMWYNMVSIGIVLYASNVSSISQIVFMLIWLLGQVAWWWFIAVLLVVFLSFVRTSPAWPGAWRLK